jgi:hypothetical protein
MKTIFYMTLTILVTPFIFFLYLVYTLSETVTKLSENLSDFLVRNTSDKLKELLW